MILKRLSILHYKNITQAELSMSNKINCFIGMNGEGKTNLLDAIYFLSMCKSSTTSQDSQTIMHNEDMMALQGYYEREDGTPEVIHCGLKRGQKKVVRRGKKAYKKLSEHIGFIPLIMVSPADQLLISGGSEERRRFLDIVISQYDVKYLDAYFALLGVVGLTEKAPVFHPGRFDVGIIGPGALTTIIPVAET